MLNPDPMAHVCEHCDESNAPRHPDLFYGWCCSECKKILDEMFGDEE